MEKEKIFEFGYYDYDNTFYQLAQKFLKFKANFRLPSHQIYARVEGEKYYHEVPVSAEFMEKVIREW